MKTRNTTAMQNYGGYEEPDNQGEVTETDNQNQEVKSGGLVLSYAVSREEHLMNTAQNIAGIYRDCLSIEARTKQTQMMTELEITKTIAKFRSVEDFLQKTFGERDKALTKHYNLLDKGVVANDREMILAALHGISSIVTKSPLDDFDKFVALYNDTSKPLLDF